MSDSEATKPRFAYGAKRLNRFGKKRPVKAAAPQPTATPAPATPPPATPQK